MVVWGALFWYLCELWVVAIFVSGMFGPWVFVVAWAFGVGVVCFCVLFFLLEGVVFSVFGSSFLCIFVCFLGLFFFVPVAFFIL